MVKTFRQSKPGASEEEINHFLDSNALEFKGEGFNDEADGLEKILDLLMQDEELDEVSERAFEKHDVASGDEPRSRRHNPLWTPSTKPIESPKGGLFTPSDKRVMKKTKAPETPRGSIKRLIDDDPKVDTKSLKDIWDAEREKLLELVRKRNKESGVRFWE